MIHLGFLKTCVLLVIVRAVGSSSEDYFNFTDDSLRIYNGQPVKIQQLPYVVLVSDRVLMSSCTGGLIHAQWVMSAGHCVGDEALSRIIEISAGLDDVYNRGPYYQRQFAWYIARHPKYKHEYSPYDISVIKTFDPFVLNPGVQIVPLSREPWSPSEMYTRRCVAAGWGMYSDFDSSSVLRVAYVTARHGPKGCFCQGTERNKQFICLEKKARACPGDSGSLLVCGGKAVGVASAMYVPEFCGKRYNKEDIKCHLSISIYIYICVMFDWLNTHEMPNAPRVLRDCRAHSRRSGGLFGGVSDEWGSASMQSSSLLLIATVQLFFCVKLLRSLSKN